MSTYVTRVIEVKVPCITKVIYGMNETKINEQINEITDMKDGDVIKINDNRKNPYRKYNESTGTWDEQSSCEYRWELVKYYCDSKLDPYMTRVEVKDTLPKVGISVREINEFCDNGGSIRDEYLNSFHGNDEYINRGVPGDISDEARKVIHANEPDWGWGYTYMLLSEIETLYSKEFESFKSEVIDAVTEIKLKTLEAKLDKIYDKLYPDDKAVLTDNNAEKTDDEYKDFFNSDEDEDGDTSWKIKYLFEEKYWDISYLHSELVKVHHTVEQLYGYMNESDIRVLYYFS